MLLAGLSVIPKISLVSSLVFGYVNRLPLIFLDDCSWGRHKNCHITGFLAIRSYKGSCSFLCLANLFKDQKSSLLEASSLPQISFPASGSAYFSFRISFSCALHAIEECHWKERGIRGKRTGMLPLMLLCFVNFAKLFLASCVC